MDSVTSVAVAWGAMGLSVLETNADGLRLLPAGRSTDLPWLGISTLAITLSGAESLSSGDVSVSGSTVADYGPVTISGAGSTYVLSLAQSINAPDRVTLVIGNAGINTYSRRLDVLPADVNDDGVVNAQDLTLVRNAKMAPYNPIDDIDGNGVIDINDCNLARISAGHRLP